MRGFIIVLIFLMLAFSVTAIEQNLPGSYLNRTTGASYPSLDVSGIKYEPFPVEPGESFDLWLRIKNRGNVDAKDVKVEFIESNTFSYAGKKILELNNIPSTQEIVVKFEGLKVNENAIEGKNLIDFNIIQGGAYSDTKTARIGIEIRSVTPTFFIRVNSFPEKIPQGSKGNITLTVTNLDKSILKDISVKMTLPKEIVPIGSTTERKINRLNPSEAQVLSFEVTPLADAEAKAYKIELNLTYFDEIGNKFVKEDSIGVLVGSSVNFDLNIEESEAGKQSKNGLVTISISNTGPDEIKFLTLEVLGSEDYEILSAKKSYLGNLESDDFETAQFDMFLKKTGVIPIKVKVSYRDSYNEEFSDIQELYLKSYSSLELRRYGLIQGNNFINFIIYIFLVVFIYLTYKNWRKEKNIVNAGKNSFTAIIYWIIRQVKKLRWRYIKRIPERIMRFFRDA
nr:hypothetical protein [Candidatus Woesearchaeota archaeon]